MQKRTWTLGAVLLVVALVVAACGGSHHPRSVPSDATAAIPTTSPKPQNVYPAVGNKAGVVAHGSAPHNSLEPGLTYTCAAGLHTFDVHYNQSVNYNGTVVSFESNNDGGGLADQTSITVTFSGNLATFAAISMIVHANNFYELQQKNVTFYEDDQVVNLSPSMFVDSAGIILGIVDFAPVTGIGGLTFCTH